MVEQRTQYSMLSLPSNWPWSNSSRQDYPPINLSPLPSNRPPMVGKAAGAICKSPSLELTQNHLLGGQSLCHEMAAQCHAKEQSDEDAHCGSSRFLLALRLFATALLASLILLLAPVARADVTLPPIATGAYPAAIAVNPAMNKVYVTNRGNGTVTVIDAATNDTLTVTAGSLPVAAVVDPVTNKAMSPTAAAAL